MLQVRKAYINIKKAFSNVSQAHMSRLVILKYEIYV